MSTTGRAASRIGWPADGTAGLAGAAAVGLIALGLGSVEAQVFGQQWLEPLVLALLIGVVLRNVVPSPARFAAGASFAAKQVLEVGVALLGATVDVRQIVAAGPALLAVVLAGVFLGIATSYGAGRLLGLSGVLAFLVAVGNSICGNSAIAAVAPVIRAEKKDVASAIGLTAVIGVCLVLALPLLIPLFLLDHYQYGVLAGMSVYAVPQVIAAAYPVSRLSGDVATLVKLTRVILLGPIVLLTAIVMARRGGPGQAKRGFNTYAPWFVVIFLALAAIRSLGVLPDAIALPAREASRGLTIVAMAGLGFGVDLAAVRAVGARVAAAVIVSLAFMASLTLVLIRLLGIAGPR